MYLIEKGEWANFAFISFHKTIPMVIVMTTVITSIAAYMRLQEAKYYFISTP